MEAELDMDEGFSLGDILKKLGFQFDGQVFTFDFSNCKLQGAKIYNSRFQQVFDFYGYYVNQRTASFIEFQVPAEVESFEQGVAFLAYYLQNSHLSIRPDWLADGLSWQFQLPWVRDQLEYENLPKAMIDRDWFKLIVNKIIILAKNTNDDDLTTFSFDGEILRIICNNEKIICAATGQAWLSSISVKTGSLKRLPKRIKKNGIFRIYIFRNKLHVGNHIFELVT